MFPFDAELDSRPGHANGRPSDSIGSVLCDLLAAGNAPAEGPDYDELGKPSNGSTLGAASTFAPTSRPRSAPFARPDERHRSPTLAGYAAYLESHPEEFARLLNSLLIKSHGVLPGPEALRVPGRPCPPRVSLGGPARSARTPHLVGRLFHRRRGLLPGHRRRRSPPRRSSRGRRSGSSRRTSTATRSPFARRGIYPPAALKGLPAGARGRYFVKSDGGYEVAKRLRALMVFGEHDLGERAPFPRIDLLLCRNVLIYFAGAHAAGRPRDVRVLIGGRAVGLALGTSESVMALPERSKRSTRACGSIGGGPELRDPTDATGGAPPPSEPGISARSGHPSHAPRRPRVAEFVGVGG